MIDAKVKVYLVDAFDALVSESNETHRMEKAIDAREQVMAWIDGVVAERHRLRAALDDVLSGMDNLLEPNTSVISDSYRLRVGLKKIRDKVATSIREDA